MNKGMMMMLKAFGLELTPEQIAAVQDFALHLPDRYNAIVNTINAALVNFDQRLRALEKGQNAHFEALTSLNKTMLISEGSINKAVEVFNVHSERISDASRSTSRRNRGTGAGAGDDSGS